MIIIYGAYPYTKTRGLVGDYCPVCEEPRAFVLTDHYELPHIYFIPFARFYQLTVRTCQGCGSETQCKRKAYAQVVPHSRSRGMHTEALLAETNAALHALVVAERQAAAAPDSQAEAVRAMRILQQYHTRREAAPLIQRMQQWPQLSGSARQQLLEEIEELHAIQEQNETVLQFLLNALKTAPEAAHLLLVMPLFLVLLGSAYFFVGAIDFPAVLGAILGVFLIDTLLCTWIYNRLTNWRYRRWIRNKLIPLAEQAGIDFLILCAVLNEDWPKEILEHRQFAALRKRQKLVVEVLAEEGKLPADFFAG